MTKKHFEAIARVLNAEQSDKTGEARDALRDVAIRLAAQFNMDNPRFDRDKFLTACGF